MNDTDGGIGEWLHDFVASLQTQIRSITGDGVRDTLTTIREVLPRDIEFVIHEVPSGTPILDWTVPKEWNVRSARLVGPDGKVIVDIADNPLHLLGYSVPMRTTISLEELRPHLFSMPDRPTWIPYRTSYFNENWGFCLTHEQLSQLVDGDHVVEIDTSLTDGSLTYAEVVLPGSSSEEFLLTSHVCHPLMANDNGSGMAMVAALIRHLAGRERRHTFRFLLIPGTVGSLAWLAVNRDRVAQIRHGLVLTGLGDRGQPTYKRSRRGNSIVDRAAALALDETGRSHRVVDFSPYGYDERQFCSPGFDMPVGRLGRSPHGEYPEYHTSADNLDFICAESLADSFAIICRTIDICEAERVWKNTAMYGEPQLGRRGLYRSIGATMNRASVEMGLLWVLNLADGSRGLLDIAERAGLPFDAIADAASALANVDLLIEASSGRTPLPTSSTE